MIQYTTAPLPFAGQKRRWLKQLEPIIRSLPSTATFVDVFGGSGLVSRLCKDVHPTARVIYNDYDNYSERLRHIAETEQLRQEIVSILSSIKHNARVPDEYKTLVLQAIQAHQDRYHYVDWITLSGWLLFTNNFAYSLEDLASRGFYAHPSRTALSDADASERYLRGLEIVSVDYRELLSVYKDVSNTILILDPPYLSTECSGYRGSSWSCDDYLDLLTSMPTNNYLYFSSTKFDFVPFLRRTSAAWGYQHPFVTVQVLYRSNSFGSGGANPEVLYYKLSSD